MSKTEIETTYNIKTNFLEYMRVHKSVKKFKGAASKTKYGPIYPLNALAVGTQLKGTNKFRKVLTHVNKDLNESLSKKWDQKLNVVRTEKDWSKIFKNCFNTIQDSNLIWFQYRTIFRILGTKSLRKKMGKCASNICRFCQQPEESIEQLFVTCEHVKKLWADIKHFSSINQIGELKIKPENILLGEWNKNKLQLISFI